MNLILTSNIPRTSGTHATSKILDSSVIPYCINVDKKKCLDITYNKVVTGGNDPSITKSTRFAQYIRNSPGCKRISGYT